MFWFLLLFLLLAFAPVAVVVLYGGRRLGKVAYDIPADSVLSWPMVSVLVPVKGALPGMRRCLDAIVRQDYPCYEVLFITESSEDAAVPVIAEVVESANGVERVSGLQHTGHVVSRLATMCGQKNQNLLTALTKISSESEVFVFCDSAHWPRTDWLRHLVAPIARGDAVSATAYHHGLPEPHTPANLGKAITILALYMLQEIDPITQPWGGNTAIRRDTFERLDIASLWGENVVDDVSLASALDKAGLKATPVPAAHLETNLSGESYTSWRSWFERQWLYLKFIYPGTWLCVGAVLYCITAMTILSPILLLLGTCGLLGTGSTVLVLLYLLGLFWLGFRARSLHPSPGSFYNWMRSFFTVLCWAGITHAATILTQELQWRDTVYKVGLHGKVLSLRRK